MFHFFDLGGLSTADGRTVAPQRLLRGGSLFRIGRRGVQRLRAHNLHTVLDLRTHAEALQRPDRIIAGVQYAHIPLFEERVVGITREKTHNYLAMLRNMTDIANLYAAMVTDPYCLAHLGQVLRFVMQRAAEGTVLYHCTAGKDRTGLVTALLLSVLRVDKTQIFDNYTAINRYQRGIAKGCYALAFLLTFDRSLAVKGKDYFTADPRYLQVAFDVIDQRYGGVETFITQVLGVDVATQRAFCDAVLV